MTEVSIFKRNFPSLLRIIISLKLNLAMYTDNSAWIAHITQSISREIFFGRMSLLMFYGSVKKLVLAAFL